MERALARVLSGLDRLLELGEHVVEAAVTLPADAVHHLSEERHPARPPERAGQDVLRGIARNRAVIVSPLSARPWWWWWRLAMPLALNFVDLTRQARREIEETATAA